MHPVIIEAVAAQRNKELRASSPGSAGAAGLRWLWALVAADGSQVYWGTGCKGADNNKICAFGLPAS
jgi:hypothetical protein